MKSENLASTHFLQVNTVNFGQHTNIFLNLPKFEQWPRII